MTLATKPCATCNRDLPLTDYNGRQRSCRDCSTKKRREVAAEKPGAAEIRFTIIRFSRLIRFNGDGRIREVFRSCRWRSVVPPFGERSRHGAVLPAVPVGLPLPARQLVDQHVGQGLGSMAMVTAAAPA